jgi:hypothetical protein
VTAQWLDITTASRLVGLSRELVLRRARAGKYGPVKQSGDRSDAIEISSYGLSLVAGRFFSDTYIEAARAGKPDLWRYAGSNADRQYDERLLSGRELPPEVIGAEVAAYPHETKETNNA